MESFTPFEIYGDEETFRIKADIDWFPEYTELFASHDYEPNGYCWESHIIQILEKENPDLLNHLDFDPEAGAFFAVADSKQSQLDFVTTLSPIFQDLRKLEAYIQAADRSRVDD